MSTTLSGFAQWLAKQVFEAGPEVDEQEDGRPGALIDLQCGKTCFNDVPARMRSELWLSQLHREGKGAEAARRYPVLLAQVAQKLPASVLDEIDKDTHRTFPGHYRLATLEGQRSMLHVLSAYAVLDPAIGYTQGMNFLAGLLLTYIPDEAGAFGALVLLMRDRGLRDLYLPDMAMLQVRLWQLGRLLPPGLEEHLERHAVLPVLYASSWLLTCFAADFPLSFAARVMDLIITEAYAAPIMKVAVGILQRCGPELLGMDDIESMALHIKRAVPRWPRRTLQDLLTEAISRPWTPRQARVLAQINDSETVVEAVARVNGLAARASDAGEMPSPVPAPGGAAAAAGKGAAPAACDGPAPAPQQPASPALDAPPPPSGSRAAGLPPLPGPQRRQVSWEAWAPSTPQLESVMSSQVRIEGEIGEHLRLDAQLSRALSAYGPHLGEDQSQSQQQQQPASGESSTPREFSTPRVDARPLRPVAEAGGTPRRLAASPFESTAQPASWSPSSAPSPPQPPAAEGFFQDDFGSFQVAPADAAAAVAASGRQQPAGAAEVAAAHSGGSSEFGRWESGQAAAPPAAGCMQSGLSSRQDSLGTMRSTQQLLADQLPAVPVNSSCVPPARRAQALMEAQLEGLRLSPRDPGKGREDRGEG